MVLQREVKARNPQTYREVQLMFSRLWANSGRHWESRIVYGTAICTRTDHSTRGNTFNQQTPLDALFLYGRCIVIHTSFHHRDARAGRLDSGRIDSDIT